jgi:hypothetical protein
VVAASHEKAVITGVCPAFRKEMPEPEKGEVGALSSELPGHNCAPHEALRSRVRRGVSCISSRIVYNFT